MDPIDFNTSLALLLRDGARRDQFRQNPRQVAEEIGLSDADWATFVALSPVELEVQADILLRKRLDRVKQLVPELCARLAGELWVRFRDYSRHEWAEDAVRDAIAFGEYLLVNAPASVPQGELNRLRFHSDEHWLRFHWLRERGSGFRLGAVQILRRTRRGKVHETRLFLAAGSTANQG